MPKTDLLISPAVLPTTPSTKPSKSGDNSGLSGSGLQPRTKSPNGLPEKIRESVPDSGAKVTIK